MGMGKPSWYLPPLPLFSADVVSGFAPLSVQFSDDTIGGSKPIISWNWSFGDGATSTAQNPEHIYSNPGIYTVSLSVTDESNLTYTYTRQNYITAMLFASEITLQSNQSIDFGSLNIPEQSEYQQVKFTNTGGLDLVISDIHFISATSEFEFIHPNPNMMVAPGVQDTILVRFVPQTLGACVDTLFIVNNSINEPILRISLSGIGLHVPPQPPGNVAILMDGSNAVISWDAVSETVLHTPLIPDYYLVFYNGSGDIDADFYYLGWTESLSYTHQRVGLHASYMFYRVLAYKYYGRGSEDIASLGLEPGMKEDEVLLRLRR